MDRTSNTTSDNVPEAEPLSIQGKALEELRASMSQSEYRVYCMNLDDKMCEDLEYMLRVEDCHREDWCLSNLHWSTARNTARNQRNAFITAKTDLQSANEGPIRSRRDERRIRRQIVRQQEEQQATQLQVERAMRRQQEAQALFALGDDSESDGSILQRIIDGNELYQQNWADRVGSLTTLERENRSLMSCAMQKYALRYQIYLQDVHMEHRLREARVHMEGLEFRLQVAVAMQMLRWQLSLREEKIHFRYGPE